MNLCDGIIRARYRESLTDPKLLEPNKVYQYEIDLGVTGNVFRKGHSIRVEISSSNFPRFDRNLNTGHQLGMDDDHSIHKAQNARDFVKIHSLKHDSFGIFEYRSRIEGLSIGIPMVIETDA